LVLVFALAFVVGPQQSLAKPKNTSVSWANQSSNFLGPS